MRLKRLLPILLLVLGLPLFTLAQVTTGSITGTVSDSKGTPLIGATVTAIHQPSGTKYVTLSKKDGLFALPATRIGGPYKLSVDYVGYTTNVTEGFTVQLGEAFNTNITMGENARQLGDVVISGTKRKSSADKTGASTVIGTRQLSTLPTITRSISDYTRLTPQSNGTNFGGRDYRYNNLKVDGANLNNSFGTSSDLLPGGGAQPITLESYDEISVNIAPYDVRQSGFTGAGINAVTKSGTNSFHGSAYTYYRDNSFYGARIGTSNISSQISDSKNQVFGGTFGGPIIKNKLFFFISGEYEKSTAPGITYSPKGGSGTGTASSTSVDSLKALSDYLQSKFGYSTGAYDNFPNFQNKNHKILAKIDWNISTVHKLTVKYTDLEGTSDQSLNASSIPGGGGFTVSGRTSTVTRLPFNRFSNTSMAYANSNYSFKNIVRTATVELNSSFSPKMANQFLAAYTKNQSTRQQPGAVFPTIDIFDGAGNNQISAGSDPFTLNNDVTTKVYSVTDNFTYYAGKHTITAGGTYEYQNVGNMYMPGAASYYAFNSLADVLANKAPAYFAYTYSLVPGKTAVYASQLKFGQLGLYIQDELNVNKNFKITFGLRADRAIYPDQPLENPNITAYKFANSNGDSVNYNTGKWPESRWLMSPRVGFRWDIKGDKSILLRGGTGIFTGAIPFVFLTNMPSNSYMYQSTVAIKDAATLANYTLSSDPNKYRDNFSSTAGVLPSNASIVLIDPNFKFPSVFRTNLAVDKNLGSGFTLTLEGLITKDINAVKMRNANLIDANGTFTEGDITRPRYITGVSNKLYSNLGSAIVLENTNKGYSYSMTAQLTKAFANGFYGSVAYTYSKAKDVTANPGSQASSVWNSNPNVGTSNDVELGNSQYAIPHRVIGVFSYRYEYANHTASTLSLFYQGSNQGNPYSFVVNGDLNGDGNSTADLMYIPKNANDITFVQNGNYTAQQQAVAFEKFINSSPYLRNHRGQVAGRYSALLPWYNRVDMRFLQDFFVKIGNTKHTIQLSADILNLPNLLSRNWGSQKLAVTSNPLTYKGIDATTNKPYYTLQTISGALVTKAFQTDYSTYSTWSLQIGVKYLF